MKILEEIYQLYEEAIKDAQSMWLSEYCCSNEESEQRKKEDQESLNYMKELLHIIETKGDEEIL